MNENIASAAASTVSIEREGLPLTASLKEYCEKFPNVTLADLSKATGGNLTVMRSKAKEPVVGEVYDPEKINYSAVEKYLRTRNPNLKLETLLWEEMNTPKEKVSRTLVLDYTVGTEYSIKRLKGNFKIAVVTETHVCLIPCDPSDTILRAYHKDTFKAYSPQLVAAPATTEEEETNNG